MQQQLSKHAEGTCLVRETAPQPTLFGPDRDVDLLIGRPRCVPREGRYAIGGLREECSLSPSPRAVGGERLQHPTSRQKSALCGGRPAPGSAWTPCRGTLTGDCTPTSKLWETAGFVMICYLFLWVYSIRFRLIKDQVRIWVHKFNLAISLRLPWWRIFTPCWSLYKDNVFLRFTLCTGPIGRVA